MAMFNRSKLNFIKLFILLIALLTSTINLAQTKEQIDIDNKAKELDITTTELQGILKSALRNGEGGDPQPEALTTIILTGESAVDYFGVSVSTAGDVNGDGYSDVIVGAYGNDAGGSFAGRSYIYFGGVVMDNTIDVTMTGESAVDYFGYSVSTAGDVNGDGYSDVIVGAYFNGVGGIEAGRSYIYYGGASMDNIADVTMTGEAAGDQFGISVSTAGDVNGDGYSDVIVGARYDDTGGSNAGRSNIYFGGASMDNIADVIMTGEAADDYFGWSVSTAGDVNGDGYSDVIVGALLNNAGGTWAGRSYIYFGGTAMDNIADVTMTGEAAGDRFGESVSTAGDVNGDGYSDVIVGAPYNDAGGASAGRSYIYFGGTSMDNTIDVTMTGEAANDVFGESVSTAGDVNGDGYSDVIVGARGNDAGGASAGRSYIYFGGTSMDNTIDVIMTGETASDFFGHSVSEAGDVNSDGYSDVIVGAPWNDAGGSNAGRAYIYFNTLTGIVAYYPFNGNANDESGNGHHGTVFGATLTADRFGNPNKAFSFDGNDRIDVPDDPGLTFGSEPFTISVWAQLSAFGADGGYYIMGHSEGPGNTNKWIFWHGNDNINFIIGPSPGWIGLGTTQFQLGVWYHLVIRRDGTDLVAYVNTSQIGNATGPQFIPDPNAIFQIGTAEPDRPNRVYRGLIDDIRIYNRALTAEEIDSLYHEGGWPINQHPLVTIEEIQYQHPDSLLLYGDRPSPYNEQTVKVRGVVMAHTVVDPQSDNRPVNWAGARWLTYLYDPDGLVYPNFDCLTILQDDTTGVNQGTLFNLIDTAQVVEITLTVREYFTATEGFLLLNPITPISVIGQLSKRPDPIELSISDFMSGGVLNLLAEEYEEYYVIIRNVFTSDKNDTTGTFQINDGQGNYMTMYDRSGYFTKRGHRLTGLTTYEPPADSTTLRFIRGAIQTRVDGYYIMPIYPGDIKEIQTFPLTVEVSDGWNMVSIPGLYPLDQDVTTWWPNLTGSVFKFSGGYLPVTTAATGEGYWMKNSGAQTYSYPAIQIVPNDPISAAAGWNMFGGYENTVATSGLTTTPSGLISGSVFGYSGGYVTATTLDPGYGYWIKLTGDGVINIPGGPLAKGSSEVVEYIQEDWGKITITDNAGRSYTLYAVNGEVDLDNYELPPMPPSGMFDIRFGSDRIAEDINRSIQSIEMSGIEHPVRVRVENMSITLQDESGNNINTQLNPGEEITINNNSINKLLIISGEIGVPIEYVLEQNYPNPFNPSTTIKFAVPKESIVNLSIYNVLGELVSTLINEQKKPGYYEYNFDASNLASGVYLYRLQVVDPESSSGQGFVETKKMILQK